ncbi:PfkB family carbohydrate kinase [Alphaproteobacteria bacterium]|nr:PfkB family carbohydrate kinase [Alphaproteobacteria bacterium]
MNKIVSLDKINYIINKYKPKSKIVLCHGVFDLLHIGHLKHFKEAKNLGDILIVSVTSDRYVNKGPGRPFFTEELRLEALAEIEIVDYVILNNSPDAISLINKLKPNIYFKGPDYKKSEDDVTGKIIDERKAVKNNGGLLKFSKGFTYSSSKLLNQNFSTFNKDQKNFIKTIKKKYQFNKIRDILNKISKLKILVIGETIIDEYVFCDALGKSGKESVLALRNNRTEKYLGGVLAIAQNLIQFCDNVSVLSYNGSEKENLDFINKNIDKKVKLHSLKKINTPTIIKKRFLDDVDGKKILGVYDLNDDNLSKEEENILKSKIDKLIKSKDIVIISDFGHGIITQNIANYISKKSKKLSVNAQVNAANIGFNNIKKYKNFDTLVINASELRQEMRERNGNLMQLARKLKKEIDTKKIIVTMGKDGVFGLNEFNKTYHCPAFAGIPVDKIGAGDTLFAIFSLFINTKMIDIDLPLYLSSLAASENVKIMGNKNSVSKIDLLKSIEYMFK